MTESHPVANVRIFDPTGDGYSDSTLSSNVLELYSLLRSARKHKDNGLLVALSSCISTSIALREFELLCGFDVVFNEPGESWDAKLVCVYSDRNERTELSPALSIMVVCVAHANDVVPALECMHDSRAVIVSGERIGRYIPVVFTYKPETAKSMDITRAVVLVSPGVVARYRGSYDIESCTYRDLDEQVIEVDESLLRLGGSVS